MLPVRFDPMQELGSLQREMDDLLKRIFGPVRATEEKSFLTSSPAINSFIKDGVFHLEAELPGVDTDKLDVRMDSDELVIRGERSSSHKKEDVDYLVQESRLSTFERRMTLPEGADVDKAHANYSNGLLEVTMPITKKEVGGRKIPIEGIKSGKKSKEVH